MTLPANLKALLRQAEATRDAAAWEALARNLMRENGLSLAPARAPKAKRKARGAVNPATLTLTECRARGIKPPREKFDGGAYVYVLVTFANGQRILTGQYPRAKNPADRSAAIGNARARLLLAHSGGVFMSEKAKCPRVESARDVTDAAEIAWLRDDCFRQRAAFETFLHAPYVDGDVPRSIDWLREKREADAPDGPRFVAAARAFNAKPAWFRAQNGG